MKKYLIKMMLAVIIVVAGGVNIYNSQKENGISDVVLVNVDALADEEYTPRKYCILHIKCFDSNGHASGCRANSYTGDVCTHRTFHNHDCSSCCSI